MKIEQLEKFVRLRNESPYDSNLQFSIDLDVCGLKLKDIGKPSKYTNFDTKQVGWIWDTSLGSLKELNGKMSFHKNLLSREQSMKFGKALKKVGL